MKNIILFFNKKKKKNKDKIKILNLKKKKNKKNMKNNDLNLYQILKLTIEKLKQIHPQIDEE